MLGLAMLAPLCLHAQVIDRLVAVVNGSPLLESDWDDTLRFELLRQGRPLRSATDADRRLAFEHMLQRELVRQQMQSLYTPTAAELDRSRQSIRALFSSASDEHGWLLLLDSYGIDQTRLDAELAMQMQTMRFVEERLRPSIKVSREEVEAYYNQTLVPQLQAMGQKPDSLVMLAPHIRELLAEQKVNQYFFRWMKELRGKSNIDLRIDDALLAGLLEENETEPAPGAEGVKP